MTHSADNVLAVASDRGFPREGLDTPTLIDVALGTTEFARRPSDDLLLAAFLYYHEFDAFLPGPALPALVALWMDLHERGDSPQRHRGHRGGRRSF
jgi:hypothetical protein